MSSSKLRILIEDFEAEFFDDRVGEDIFGDALDLRFGLLAVEAVEIEDEEFALADVADARVAERGEGALDGLALGIEDGRFQHDPDVGFHGCRNSIPIKASGVETPEGVRLLARLKPCPDEKTKAKRDSSPARKLAGSE